MGSRDVTRRDLLEIAVLTSGALELVEGQLMAQKTRVMRIYEGPSEVHRMSLARQILAQVR